MTATCLSAELLALAATDASSVADHLAGCAACSKLVTAQRATRSALAMLSTPPPLAHSTRVELGDLLVACSRPRARGRRFVLAACVAGAALVALVRSCDRRRAIRPSRGPRQPAHRRSRHCPSKRRRRTAS